MQKPFLCWLIPIDPGAHPEHPIVIPPPGGGAPPGIWGPPGPWPSPPIYFPPGGGGQPPQGGAHPEHPIYYPPGIWGGANEPFPTPPIYFPPGGGQPPQGGGGGGYPSHPIWPTPPYPAHPIVPPGGYPPQGGGPDHIWGGGNVPMPNPPIANVPGAPGYHPPIKPPDIPGIDVPHPGQPIIITPDDKTWVFAVFPDGSTGWVEVDQPPVSGPTPPPPIDGHQWIPAYVPGLGWCWLSIPTPPPAPEKK